jgi:hypothetical protein
VIVSLAMFSGPVWVPVVFCLYGVLQGKFTLRLLFAFLTCECVALAVFAWLLRQLQEDNY